MSEPLQPGFVRLCYGEALLSGHHTVQLSGLPLLLLLEALDVNSALLVEPLLALLRLARAQGAAVRSPIVLSRNTSSCHPADDATGNRW